MNRQSKERLRSMRRTFERCTGNKWTGDERSFFRVMNAMERSMFNNAVRLGMVHKDRLSGDDTDSVAYPAPPPAR